MQDSGARSEGAAAPSTSGEVDGGYGGRDGGAVVGAAALDDAVLDDVLVEDVSIDGMCGVY